MIDITKRLKFNVIHKFSTVPGFNSARDETLINPPVLKNRSDGDLLT